MPHTLITLLTVVQVALAAKSPPAVRTLAPLPPKALELYQKVGALWAGNKQLYCDPNKAIAETIREMKLLREVKSAQFDATKDEIQFSTIKGGRGALDVDNIPARSGGIAAGCLN